MKARILLVGAAFFAATAMWNSAAYSQAKEEKKPAGEKPAAAQPAAAAKPGDKPAAPGPDPHMVAWIKASTPGDFHAKLKPTVGSWNTVTKQWHDPKSEPMETKGTCERKLIMDGRFLEEHYIGTFMGQPFEGKGIGGYDNVQKKYVTTWIDNLGTGIMLHTGTVDASGKVFNYTSEYADPLTGKLQKMRSVMKIIDDKTHIFEMYGPGEDGKDFKMMEVTHTRK